MNSSIANEDRSILVMVNTPEEHQEHVKNALRSLGGVVLSSLLLLALYLRTQNPILFWCLSGLYLIRIPVLIWGYFLIRQRRYLEAFRCPVATGLLMIAIVMLTMGQSGFLAGTFNLVAMMISISVFESQRHSRRFFGFAGVFYLVISALVFSHRFESAGMNTWEVQVFTTAYASLGLVFTGTLVQLPPQTAPSAARKRNHATNPRATGAGTHHRTARTERPT